MKIQEFPFAKVSLFFLLIIFSINIAFSQADAGEDKTICGSGSVVIGGGSENPDYCYSWSPTEGLRYPDQLHPIANPTKTMTYTLTVVGPDFSFKDSDQMTVTVQQASVTLTVENNITQCMEGRHITFTAEASVVFPVSNQNQLKFTFHYQDANGNPWTEEDWSWDRIEYSTVQADQVPVGDNDHKFSTPVWVEAQNDDCQASSPTLNIDVYELWIENVQDFASQKPWKVVVGKEIQYSAVSSDDCVDWNWEFPDGYPLDNWGHSGGNFKAAHDLVIPYSNLLLVNNDDFGDAHGTVRVSCKDGEGNSHTFNSSSLTPSRKVQVFFDPDKNQFGGTPSTLLPPCWFVFWKEGNVVEGMNECGYDNTLGYGGSNIFGIKLGPSACESNDGPETLINMAGSSFQMTGQGRHLNCVSETITHEKYHQYVLWTWLLSSDTDDDGLPNDEEPTPHKSYFQVSDPNDDNTFNYNAYATTGYADQEVRCRIEEIIGTIMQTYPSKDWSMDVWNPKW